MLSNRPWDAWTPDADPPPCNRQVLEYFKTMVHRFLSHYQWRKHFIDWWEQVPDKEDWLPLYWEKHLRARTPNCPWQDFGPLHLYLLYEEEASSCARKTAGLNSPYHEVRDWQTWEDMMRSEGYPVFWNPMWLF